MAQRQDTCAKKGVLLVNLGTPASTEAKAVRAWLREFLMDSRVVDLPWPVRALLVMGVIIPLRAKTTAAAYSSIWTAQGSPLLAHTDSLTQLVDKHLQDSGNPNQQISVDYGMRYGQPSIESGMLKMAEAKVRQLLIAPLYPHYAMSTTESSWQKALAVKAKYKLEMQLSLLPPFYNEPSYIRLLSDSLANQLQGLDGLLFSYHGLPERHLLRTDPTRKHCLKDAHCCQTASVAHATCYLHQAKSTSAQVAKQLNLPEGFWHTSFQSRVGSTPWLQPYTDKVLAALPKQGIRKLGVICPSFVADNLETLEEIKLRGQNTFLSAGGETFRYIACLNEQNAWGQTLSHLCLKALDNAK